MSDRRSTESERIREHLGLVAHPEGGWYRRTWADADEGQRGRASSIHYLLESAQSSRWHRIDASELWHHSAGSPMELSTWADGAATRSRILLGSDLLDGHSPQAVVEAQHWQSARCLGAWSLVTCVVVPEFSFDGFELAEQGWEPPTR